MPSIFFPKSTPIRALFAFQATFSIIFCFVNVFLNVFLWDHGQTFRGIGVFNLFSVFSIFLFSLLGAYLLQVFGTRATFMTSSILAFFLFFFLLTNTKSLPSLLPLLGMLYGGYVGLFYVGFNLMLIWLSHDSRRQYFIGLESAVATTAQLLTPLASGLFIVSYGYQPIFLIILGIVLIQILICLQIPQLKTNQRYQRRSFFLPENLQMAKLGFSSSAYGFYFAFIQMSYGLFIYFFIQDEFRLGSWNFIFGLISAIMYWIVGKHLNQSNQDLMLGLGMIASIIVTTTLMLSEPFWFILFNLTISVSLPLLWIPTKTCHFTQIKRQAKTKSTAHLERMIQFLVFREFSISLGRLLFFVLTLSSFELGIGISYYTMIILAVLMPFGIWFLNRHH
ncbi:MAG TPA: MFS transporter [Bacillota bacterium]|nr:MFS transporter [Bacillota bacterium]